MTVKECRDCLAERVAKAVAPPPGRVRPIVEGSGGRCATHWRDEKKRRKGSAHERRVQKVYGLPAGAYQALYEFQGGRCAICGRGRGISKKLAVDHDHVTGLVRGLVDANCNRMLGDLRDDLEAARRLVAYLENSPAARLNIRAIHQENRDPAG
jgi:hypothetical protein